MSASEKFVYPSDTMPKGIPRNQSIQQKILHRLKITRGQLDHVIAMVEADGYCIDIVHQTQAIRAALKNTDHILLKNHMETCMTDAAHHGKADHVIGEMMKVLEKQ